MDCIKEEYTQSMREQTPVTVTYWRDSKTKIRTYKRSRRVELGSNKHEPKLRNRVTVWLGFCPNAKAPDFI
ncbi:hypothetical protein ABKN59_001609 [Abortiporus biennis]